MTPSGTQPLLDLLKPKVHFACLSHKRGDGTLPVLLPDPMLRIQTRIRSWISRKMMKEALLVFPHCNGCKVREPRQRLMSTASLITLSRRLQSPHPSLRPLQLFGNPRSQLKNLPADESVERIPLSGPLTRRRSWPSDNPITLQDPED